MNFCLFKVSSQKYFSLICNPSVGGIVKYLGYVSFCFVCNHMSNGWIFKDWLMETPFLWDSILLFHTFANVVKVFFVWFITEVQRNWRALLYCVLFVRKFVTVIQII